MGSKLNFVYTLVQLMLETSIVAMNTYWLLPGTTEQPLFVRKENFACINVQGTDN